MSIPTFIDTGEKLGRGVFKPINFRKDNSIKPNAFRPAPDTNETSVQRMNYCTEDKCHEIGKNIEQRAENLTYRGIAIILTKVVKDNGADVKATPRINNEAHADIIFNHIFKEKEPAPPEIQIALQNIAKSAMFEPYKEEK